MEHILIVSGDPSSDRHGASLIEELKSKRPDLRVSALGGSYLRQKADTFLYPLVGVGGFGFWEPVMKLPQLWKAMATIKTLFKSDRPDLVVLMDYYGFNVHAARQAHSAGIPVAYYISPQVWASRPARIGKLAKVIDKMFVIFPFEEDLYKKAGVPVRFVGHPLIEKMPAPTGESFGPTLGLLPGSRRSTALRHLPILVQTAQKLHQEFPDARCYLFRPEEIEEEFYKPFLTGAPWIKLLTDPDYETRKTLWLTIGVSGTAALENMLLGIPMIIMYKLSQVTYRIAKALIRVPYVGIPNLLANRLVVPELLQDEATPERLAEAARPFLSTSKKRAETRQALLALRSTLAAGGSAKAAEAILEMIQ